MVEYESTRGKVYMAGFCCFWLGFSVFVDCVEQMKCYKNLSI